MEIQCEEVQVDEVQNSYEEFNRELCDEMSLFDMCSWGEAN